MNKIEIKGLDLYYGQFHALINVNALIRERCITAIIGSSGCGKSTLLRCINRMNDLVEDVRITGRVLLDGKDIYGNASDLIELRKKAGMVFQKSNPFPKTIFENVAYGLRINGVKDKYYIQERVEKSLKDAAIWDEVKDRLNKNAFELSGGQQQRHRQLGCGLR